MITDRMRRIAVMSSWLVSALSFGIVCGIGRPTRATSAIGTPMVSAVSKTMAPRPASTSPAVRCLTWTGLRRPGDRRGHQQATRASAVPQARKAVSAAVTLMVPNGPTGMNGFIDTWTLTVTSGAPCGPVPIVQPCIEAVTPTPFW